MKKHNLWTESPNQQLSEARAWGSEVQGTCRHSVTAGRRDVRGGNDDPLWWPHIWRTLLFFRRLVFDPWVRKIPWRREWLPTPVFVPGRIRRKEGLGVLQSMGSQKIGHDWVTNSFTFTLSSQRLSQNRRFFFFHSSLFCIAYYNFFLIYFNWKLITLQ